MMNSSHYLHLCGYGMEPEPIGCFFIFSIWEQGKTNPPKALRSRPKRRILLLDSRLRPAPLRVRRRPRLRAAEFPNYPVLLTHTPPESAK